MNQDLWSYFGNESCWTKISITWELVPSIQVWLWKSQKTLNCHKSLGSLLMTAFSAKQRSGRTMSIIIIIIEISQLLQMVHFSVPDLQYNQTPPSLPSRNTIVHRRTSFIEWEMLCLPFWSAASYLLDLHNCWRGSSSILVRSWDSLHVYILIMLLRRWLSWKLYQWLFGSFNQFVHSFRINPFQSKFCSRGWDILVLWAIDICPFLGFLCRAWLGLEPGAFMWPCVRWICWIIRHFLIRDHECVDGTFWRTSRWPLHNKTNSTYQHRSRWRSIIERCAGSWFMCQVMFWFAGLVGMGIESKRVRRWLAASIFNSVATTSNMPQDTITEPPSYSGSFNPFPALVIGVTGAAMATHFQTYLFQVRPLWTSNNISSALNVPSTQVQIHALWGNLLVGFSVLRCLTYFFLWLNPSRSILPSRPPTEALGSFFLACGGLTFMFSTEEVTLAAMRRGRDGMHLPFAL